MKTSLSLPSTFSLRPGNWTLKRIFTCTEPTQHRSVSIAVIYYITLSAFRFSLRLLFKKNALCCWFFPCMLDEHTKKKKIVSLGLVNFDSNQNSGASHFTVKRSVFFHIEYARRKIMHILPHLGECGHRGIWHFQLSLVSTQELQWTCQHWSNVSTVKSMTLSRNEELHWSFEPTKRLNSENYKIIRFCWFVILYFWTTVDAASSRDNILK